ncbi:obscurin-like [Fundulus heteroclitus]|uniref:obscurin-like n=1 Tax=Fundulus heteroclitus TaxID=8078 RepID=UPI00165ADFE6|nr:obscurin-like [Fundulus heteroclitus]
MFDWFRQESVSSPPQLIRTNEPDGVLRVSEGGVYSCRGGRGDPVFHTETSNEISVLKTAKLVLSVSPSWLSPGASVTLSCGGFQHPSAGWRFFWYKTVPKPPSSSYSFDLMPGSTSGTEENSYLINGQNHAAGYVCRAGRGEPVIYTDYSQPKFVWSADSPPAASLSVSPDRVQHFLHQSVTLNCTGNKTQWRVKSFPEPVRPSSSQCSWRTMTGSSCTINLLQHHSGVYWCESGSGDFSNAVNITVQNNNGLILVSPVHPVAEGDPVTLSCRDKQLKLLSKVFFYHNDKPLHNDSREELKISAVSKSDEGFYKCQYSGKESPQSWMSVTVSLSSPISSSFPLLFIVRSIIGILVIILLIFLLCYRRSKDSCCISFKLSGSSNQSSNRNDAANQPESPEYNSLLLGDVQLCESLKSPGAAANGTWSAAATDDPDYTEIESGGALE